MGPKRGNRLTAQRNAVASRRARRNLKLRQTNYWRASMASGWTPEWRALQSEAIQRWSPWEKATGPRTPAGKALVSGNAFKGARRAKLRAELAQIRDMMRALESATPNWRDDRRRPTFGRSLSVKRTPKRTRGSNKIVVPTRLTGGPTSSGFVQAALIHQLPRNPQASTSMSTAQARRTHPRWITEDVQV